MGGQAEGQATETAVRAGAPAGVVAVGVAAPTEATVATGAGAASVGTTPARAVSPSTP